MNTTPPPAPQLPATASRNDLVAFLRAHGATDYAARYRVNAAGLFNSITGQLHPCDTKPLYDLLGVPFGAEIAIGAAQVEVKQYIMLRHDGD
jgi:hypothetical protein